MPSDLDLRPLNGSPRLHGTRRQLNPVLALLYLFTVAFFFSQAGTYAANRDVANAKAKEWLAEIPQRVLSGKPRKAEEHPIKGLMQEAEEQFRAKIARQSRTLSEAAANYRSRYNRPPPAGFKEWWEFAQKNGHKLVDEYDGLMADLRPFWGFPPAEFRSRVEEAGKHPGIDIIQVRAGKVNYAESASGRTRALAAMMNKFEHLLPDMDLAMNEKSESRVLIPWDRQNDSHVIHEPPNADDTYTSDWNSRGNLWTAFQNHCPPFSRARANFAAMRAGHFPPKPPLVSTEQTVSAFPQDLFMPATPVMHDYCSDPWAHTQQGHFYTDWRALPAALPVLSVARAPGFMDIRVPSHYYYWPSRRHTYGFDTVNLVVQERDGREVPWESKRDTVFWRGPSTGGGASPKGHAKAFQRHRFVRFSDPEEGPATAGRTETVIFAHPSDTNNFVATSLEKTVLNAETIDAAFVYPAMTHAYDGGEYALRADHRFADEGAALGDTWRHKYALELDGNGYSGRFAAIMASESAMIKASVYEEFWSEWIQPWLHYVPLSPSYREIYNILAFFSGPTNATLEAAGIEGAPERPIDGDRRLRRIARAGKHWRRTMIRDVDMEAYVFRLCIEYARLWSDNRERMNYGSK